MVMMRIYILLVLNFLNYCEGRSLGCGNPLPDTAAPGQTAVYTIQIDDPGLGHVERSYRLHVPLNYEIDVAVPLVMDYHAYTSWAEHKENYTKFTEVADEDPIGFLVLTPEGMADTDDDRDYYGSWNVSRTNGPLGPICDTDRSKYEDYIAPCYTSCPSCDSQNSCDWTSCYDDIYFTRALIEVVKENFCIDSNSIHQTGMSNGGLFSYYAISELSDIFATIGPVSGAPHLGFGVVPSTPVSLIDFHGINDDMIPYDLEHSEGRGPYDSVITKAGHYYEEKLTVLRKWQVQLDCDPEGFPWKTAMDGIAGWSCTIWSACKDQVEIVACTGNHGHEFPFSKEDRIIEATRILWSFMRTHTKPSEI